MKKTETPTDIIKTDSSGVTSAINAELFLRSKISTTKFSSKSRVQPKVFTEKGLYMLATILKSKKADKKEEKKS